LTEKNWSIEKDDCDKERYMPGGKRKLQLGLQKGKNKEKHRHRKKTQTPKVLTGLCDNTPFPPYPTTCKYYLKTLHRF
jgi:hypothetical protein